MEQNKEQGKDGYAVRAILPSPEGRGLSRNQIIISYMAAALDCRQPGIPLYRYCSNSSGLSIIPSAAQVSGSLPFR